MISRREVLGAAALALPGQNSDSPAKARIVVAGGHPGDPEYGCGGLIARYTDLGHAVVLLYLNRGEKGIPGKSHAEAGAIRTAEAGKACEILKATPAFASQIDGEATIDAARYRHFHELLAAQRPDVVFTQWPIDNHPDHRATTMLVYDAWQRMNRQFALFYYEVSSGEDTVQFNPTVYLDISSVATRKRAACYAHASQSPEKFYKLQEQVAEFRGIERGYAQAEAFIHHLQSPPFSLAL
jgi:LmbE family N-acetylglucosaminyl deacetylase